MFQLVLSDKLRAELAEVAKQGGESTAQPMVFDANTMRMANMPKYSRSAHADNVALFHGREVRQVPDAAGGMNFVLHLSSSVGDDPEGWTKEELSEYNGWAHDSSRRWRKGELLFDKQPIKAVIAEIARYRRAPVWTIGDFGQASPVSGLFLIERPDEALETIARMRGLRMTTLPGGVIVIRPDPAS